MISEHEDIVTNLSESTNSLIHATSQEYFEMSVSFFSDRSVLSKILETRTLQVKTPREIPNKTYKKIIFFEWPAIYSSHIFYARMKERLIEYLRRKDVDVKVFTFEDIKGKESDSQELLILDLADVLNLLFFKKLAVKTIQERFGNYMIIVGENYDQTINTFKGWENCGLFFVENNNLQTLLKGACKISYQNNITRDFLKRTFGDKLFFMPISFYDPYSNWNTSDISDKGLDLLYYGALVYPRRFLIIPILQAFSNLNGLKFISCDNYFAINKLICTTKVNLHVNSLDSCYHIPYAKIIDPLLMKNSMVVEFTDEMANNDINKYIKTFKYPMSDYSLITKFHNQEILKLPRDHTSIKGILIKTNCELFLSIIIKDIYVRFKGYHSTPKIFMNFDSDGVLPDDRFEGWLIVKTVLIGTTFKVITNIPSMANSIQISGDSNAQYNKRTQDLIKDSAVLPQIKQEISKYEENTTLLCEACDYVKLNYNLDDIIPLIISR